MSLPGKILTVLNAIAALAFLALAGADYNARNAWAYSIFRHELAIHGLPLDDQDDSWRPGVPIAKDINARTLSDLFPDPNNYPAVATQLKAVETAKDWVQSWINQQPNDTQKRAMITALWLPLLSHWSDREQRLKEIRTKPIDGLTTDLLANFDTLTSALKAPAQSRPDSAETLRRKVADLLYATNPTVDPAVRDWTAAVVGLEEYVGAADRQATNLFAMTANIDQTIREEGAAFVRHYNDLLPKLTLLNERLRNDAVRLDAQKKILEQNTLLFQARKAERDEFVQQIAAARQTADAEAANLAAVQQQLFDLQREVAAARAANEGLEAKIRGKELGR